MAAWAVRWLKEATRQAADVWRGVEAQHKISTLRLVDSAAEQHVLEKILEASKPALPSQCAGMHYLLTTPFRYLSAWPSRFRRPHEPGVWYGAQQVHTVCAELGYWRWRFLMDSEGLKDKAILPEFTVFQARVAGRAIDLTQAPWVRFKRVWMHPVDYAECHRLAAAAREAGVQWIRYASVRDPDHRLNAAVLDAAVLSLPKPTAQQTWAAKIQADRVLLTHDDQSVQFDPMQWRDSL